MKGFCPSPACSKRILASDLLQALLCGSCTGSFRVFAGRVQKLGSTFACYTYFSEAKKNENKLH
jgi:hypothetical protein